MKLQVLSDNRCLQNDLGTEHGLCIYIETEKHRCLLDTGASDLFVHNAHKMGVDLTQIDYVFISHGHADHIGGLIHFLKINRKANVILSKNALSQQYFSVRNEIRNISNQADLSNYYSRFIFVDSPLTLGNEIHVFSCNETPFPIPLANSTLIRQTDDEILTDDFNHELIFTLGTENLLVYTGCAHKGVLNILKSVEKNIGKPVKYLIGGFHLLDGKYETENEITEIATFLATNYPQTKFLTGHCTGDNTFNILKNKLSDQLDGFYSGYTITEIKKKI
jgi:7,8-dihydropterin-6-yl-methyl-4-(beta-D-ribofuranosyl)aminobenzene 5'-phosphate synthase